MRRVLPFVLVGLVAFALGWVASRGQRKPERRPIPACDYIVVVRPDPAGPYGANSQRLKVVRTGHSFGRRDQMEWCITLSGVGVEPGDPAAVFYCVPAD